MFCMCHRFDDFNLNSERESSPKGRKSRSRSRSPRSRASSRRKSRDSRSAGESRFVSVSVRISVISMVIVHQTKLWPENYLPGATSRRVTKSIPGIETAEIGHAVTGKIARNGATVARAATTTTRVDGTVSQRTEDARQSSVVIR